MSKTFRNWYFSRRGLILIPFYSVPLFCFYGEYEVKYIIWSVGTVLILLGALFRIWTMRYIGHDARRRNLKVKTLVRTGPYLLVRNPLYLGNIIIITGFCILSEVIWFLPIFLVVLFIHYTIVAKCEEHFLFENFGEEYLRYKNEVPRWIPNLRNLKILGSAQLDWSEAIKIEFRSLVGGILIIVIMLAKEWVDIYLRGM